MTLRSCSREAEVKVLLERGQWPQAVPAELRAHVAGCRKCGDLTLVMQALGGARLAAMQALPAHVLPEQAAGALWWRAQLRRRNAAIEKLGRPILTAQIFALAVAMLAAAMVVLSQVGNGLAWLAELGKSRAFHLDALWTTASSNTASAATSASAAHPELASGLLVPVVVMLVVLGGVVVYLASGLDASGLDSKRD